MLFQPPHRSRGPQDFFQNHAIFRHFRGNPLFWANFRLRAPLGSNLCWPPWPKSWIRSCRLSPLPTPYVQPCSFSREFQCCNILAGQHLKFLSQGNKNRNGGTRRCFEVYEAKKKCFLFLATTMTCIIKMCVTQPLKIPVMFWLCPHHKNVQNFRRQSKKKSVFLTNAKLEGTACVSKRTKLQQKYQQ